MHNSFRRLALSGLLIAGLTAGMAYAQNASDPTASAPATTPRASHAPNPDRQLKHLTKALNLSTDQQNQIKPILADEDQQIQTVRSDTSMAPKDRRSKLMDIHKDANDKLEAVLNDQQKQQFEQMKTQHHGRAHHKAAGDTTSGTAAQPQSQPQP